MNILDEVLVLFYQFKLDSFNYFLPKHFLFSETKVEKGSKDFEIYLAIINSYCRLIFSVRQNGRNFLNKLQEKRLKKIINVASRIKWWEDFFLKNSINPKKITSLDGLRSIPPVNRNFLIDVDKAFLTAKVNDKDRIQINSTSGSTTGTPFLIYFDRSVSVINVTAHYVATLIEQGFNFERNKYKNFLAHLNLFGGVQRLTTAPEQFATRLSLRGISHEGFNGEIRTITSILKGIRDVVLFTHPSELPLFIQKLKDNNIEPTIKLCIIIGNILEPDVRKLTEEYLKCRVISVYGLREHMIVATSCKDYPDLFHSHGERMVLEILDERGNAAEEDFGEITITGLDNFVMPLIRYQPGDRARFHKNKRCSCSNPTPLFEIESRSSDTFIFNDGSKKRTRGFMSIFAKDPLVNLVRRFQVVQKTSTEIRVFVELRAIEHKEKVKKTLGNFFKRYKKEIPHDINIKLDFTEIDLGKGKYKPFIRLKSK